MDIPVVNRIIDFQSTTNPLHDPSLLSQISVYGIGKAYQTCNLWKWGALILALIASVTAIVNKLKLLIIRLQNYRSVTSGQYLLDEDDEYESETDSSCSISDDEADEEEWEEEEAAEESATTSFYGDEDFRVRGSGHVHIDEKLQKSNLGLGLKRRRRSIGDLFSWSGLTSGKSVVELWDNLGLGLGLNVEESSVNEFTIYDINNDREIRKITSIFGRRDEIPAFVSTSSSSPAVIFSAAATESCRVSLSGWDTRVGSKLPTILAEWSPKQGNIVGVQSGGLEKFYVIDDVSNALTVVDMMRKVNTPLDDPTKTDVDTWWDADAVIITEDCFLDSN